jgi:hypothetical protein
VARRPALEKYPRLHALLRNDPIANAQFNNCLNEQQQAQLAGTDPAEALATKLAKSECNLAELLEKHAVLLKSTSKARRLITLLGTTMEQQLNLRPYTQDINECSVYDVKFNAGQVRLVLSIYWDLLTREAEDLLQGTMDNLTDVEEE